MTYEDVFRNFIGVAWADSDGLSNYEELEGDDINQELLDELGWEEFPEDFDWWDSIDELDGMSGQEYIDDAVYNWFENQ